MSCEYKYKSGIRKGEFCGSKNIIKGCNYCSTHKRYMKGKKNPTHKSINIGTNTNEDNFKSTITNLLSLFDNGPLIRQNAMTENEIEEKIEEIEEIEEIEKSTEIIFDVESKNLDNITGLLKTIQLYKNRPISDISTINYDLERLCRIEQDLYNLNNMIGISTFKNKICDMIIYLCQKQSIDKINKDKEKNNIENHEYLHTVLQGPPGCGKTTLANILAQIYKKLGFISNGNLVYAKRSDLVGKYCGHTASLTQSKINEARGGVLFIDEAYSLGNKEDNPDAFSTECIDTLNQNLSERNDFICIIAGYKKELDSRFFGVNPGLSRRFPWVFSIDDYSSKELSEMFKRKLQELNFKLEEDALKENFFNHNRENFPYFGGSIHTFINKIKICNYKRLFGKLNKENTVTRTDINNAFEMYKLLEMGSLKVEGNKPPFGMYN